MKRSCSKSVPSKFTFSLSLVALVLLAWIPMAPATKTGFDWSLRSTGVESGHAVALFIHPETGEQRWVKPGETFDSTRVLRVERGRVFVLADHQRIALTLPDVRPEDLPPLIQSPKDAAEPGKDLNAFLNHEVMRQVESPVRISQSQHRAVVKRLQELVEQGQVTPETKTLVVGGGEEWISGMRALSGIQELGIQPQDLILMINGIAPEASKKRWDEILNVVERAKLVIVAYVRDDAVYSQVFQVSE